MDRTVLKKNILTQTYRLVFSFIFSNLTETLAVGKMTFTRSCCKSAYRPPSGRREMIRQTTSPARYSSKSRNVESTWTSRIEYHGIRRSLTPSEIRRRGIGQRLRSQQSPTDLVFKSVASLAAVNSSKINSSGRFSFTLFSERHEFSASIIFFISGLFCSVSGWFWLFMFVP